MRMVGGVLTLLSACLVVASAASGMGTLALAAAVSGLAAGALGWLAGRRAAPPPVAKPAPPPRGLDQMSILLRELAEEMVRLRRDGAETSRGMAEARASGARMVQAATTAIARLDESAETSAIAARALSMLPGIADSHAQRIELMAGRAEHALAQVPEMLAIPPALDGVVARLEGIALPDTAALRDAVERLDRLAGDIGQAMHGSLAEAHDAAAALLDGAAARIEAARPDPMLAMGLMEATERLEALAAPLERAAEPDLALAERLEAAVAALAVPPDLSAAGDALVELVREALDPAAGLEERIAGLDAGLASFTAQMEALPPRMEAAREWAVALDSRLAALDGGLERLAGVADTLPPAAEAAQRATDALLRAAQANLALAGRGRAEPAPPPETVEPEPEPDAPPLSQPDGDPPATEQPARAPRLLENLDETIRGLQSLSSVLAAAAERRPEPAL